MTVAYLPSRAVQFVCILLLIWNLFTHFLVESAVLLTLALFWSQLSA